MVQRKKLAFELGVEAFLTCLVVFLLIVSYQPQRILVTTGDNMGPFVFPRIILYLFLSLMAIDMTRVIVKLAHTAKDIQGKKFSVLPRPVLLTLGAIVVYTLLWNVIGFTLSTVLFLTAETKIVNSDIPLKSGLLVAVCASAVLVVIFVFLFKMDFPEPLLALIRGY